MNVFLVGILSALPQQVTQVSGLGSWGTPFDHATCATPPCTPTCPDPTTSDWEPFFQGTRNLVGMGGNTYTHNVPTVMDCCDQNVQLSHQGRFNSLHLALIPVGEHRGSVFAFAGTSLWLYNPPSPISPPCWTDPHWYTFWSVIDNPSNPAPSDFHNFKLKMDEFADGVDPIAADLFCSGHTWTHDGRLFVAGGTSQYPFQSDFRGVTFAYTFDPRDFDPNPSGGVFDNNGWKQECYMHLDRWYPSVNLSHDNRILVSGGVDELNRMCGEDPYCLYPENSFEIWNPGSDKLCTSDPMDSGNWVTNSETCNGSPNLPVFPGPNGSGSPTGLRFDYYPRMHLLSTGDFFMSGFSEHSALLNIASPGDTVTWSYPATSSTYRLYGSSILVPEEEDVVMVLGGVAHGDACGDPDNSSTKNPATESVEWIDLDPMTPNTWQSCSSMLDMIEKRVCHNTVILPMPRSS